MNYIRESQVMYYALKVNGQIISRPVTATYLLEAQRDALADHLKATAQIVRVNESGQELLLG